MSEFKLSDHQKNVCYVYADGATRDNQNKKNLGAWGYYLYFNNNCSFDSGIELNTTNNKMELYSIISALNKIKNKKAKTIVTMDSKYVVDGINEWSKKWKKNGFRNSQKEEIKNIELWRWLLDLVDKFDNIVFNYCKAHKDTEGNNKADLLCNEAMDKYINEQN
jgi:ribonuclease HI